MPCEGMTSSPSASLQHDKSKHGSDQKDGKRNGKEYDSYFVFFLLKGSQVYTHKMIASFRAF